MFSVYPNPVTNRLLLNVIGDKEITNIQVYNLEGQLVLSTSHSFDLDVSGLQKGIYLVKVKHDGELKISKFIKL